MKCEESVVLIEAYFDGELDPQRAELVSTHIENCLSCKRELQQLGFEAGVYQSYERDVEPSPALWAGVRSRIAEELPMRPPTTWERWQVGIGNLMSLRFNVAVSAALVLAAVVGTVVVMKYLDRKPAQSATALPIPTPAEVKTANEGTPPTNDPPSGTKAAAVASNLTEGKKRDTGRLRREPTPATRPAAARENPAVFKTPSQLVRDAESNYLGAIAILTRDVAQRPSQLDSKTRAKLDNALASIDRTISATRRAVKKNPNDPLAVQYMLTAYAKKVDVLKEMTKY
jgi:hypothetical protein